MSVTENTPEVDAIAPEEYFSVEWPPDAEGIPHRQAARVVLCNEFDEFLLLRGHDFSDTSHWWWFTIGGGLGPGEEPHQGARREFFEETGYLLDEGALVGPVLRRHAPFDFHAITCRQDEDFFFARIWGHPGFSSRGFTAVEKQVLDEWRWWNLDDLEAEGQGGTVGYPLNFVTLARSWRKGWDGSCPEITEGTVGKR